MLRRPKTSKHVLLDAKATLPSPLLAPDSNKSAGSDDSRRLWGESTNAKMEELDRDSVRERLDRCPLAMLEVFTAKKNNILESTSQEAVGQAGVMFTSRQGGIVVPSAGPEWAYGRTMRSCAMEGLPQGSCLIFHMGDQRTYLRSRGPPGSSSDDLKIYLDVTASLKRDRMLLHHDMEIVLVDMEKKTEQTIRVAVPVGGCSGAELSWHRDIEDQDLFKLRGRPSVPSSLSDSYGSTNAPSSATSTAFSSGAFDSMASPEDADYAGASTLVTTQTPTTSTKKKKSVSWGPSMDLVDKSLSKLPEDNDYSSNATTVQGQKQLSSSGKTNGSLYTGAALVTMDGREIAKMDTINERRCVWFVSSGTLDNNNNKDPTDIIERLAGNQEFAMCISVELGAVQLILPRVVSAVRSPSAFRVLIRAPSKKAFPIITGDRIVVSARNTPKEPSNTSSNRSLTSLSGVPPTHREVCHFQVTVPKMSRSPPVTDQDKFDTNPCHSLRELGLEVSIQGGKSSEEAQAEQSAPSSSSTPVSSRTTVSAPRAFVVSPKWFSVHDNLRIGRQEADIVVPDSHLSKTHVRFRRKGKHYLAEPADPKKVIHLLCGKADVHARPPVPLRTGDTICCGKTEFKVVYQQRGNREVTASASSAAEIRARLEAVVPELRVKKDCPSVGSNPGTAATAGEEETTSDASTGDVPSSSSSSFYASATTSVPEVSNQFRTLNLSITESSSSFASARASASFENVLFSDPQELLDLFDKDEGSRFGAARPFMILHAVKGPRAKRFFMVDALESTVGSSPFARVSVGSDLRMSPYHCRLYFDQMIQRWVVEDMQSEHGTFVRVAEPTLMASGDVLVMGATLVRVLGHQLSAPQFHSSGSGRCVQS